MKLRKTLNSITKQKEFSDKEKKLIGKAYLFAENAHEGQFLGKIPFFNHPAHAGYILAKSKQSGDAVSAALLHDVVEDCEVKLSEIKNNFGEKVAFYVNGMSHSKRKINGKLKTDYEAYYKKFFNGVKQDPILAIIKASDEMSRPLSKNPEKIVNKLKEKGIWEKYQQMINERMRGLWIPFFNEIGFYNVVKRIQGRARFVKEENVKITLYNYLSKEDLKKIKEKINKTKGVENLR